MLLFNRRDLQAGLDQLSGVLPVGDVDKLADRLNRPGPDRLPTCWEVVLLAAFSKVGRIKQEDALSNRKRPDLWYFDAGTPDECLFVADITAVSDADRHREYPMAQFSQEIQKCARKVGLSVNDVHIQYEAELDTGRRVPKTRLKLPPKGQYFQFIAQHVLPFFRRIQASSSNSDSLRLTADGADITVTFQRGKRFFGASYTPVTGIHALTNNVLWNALQLKAKKLKASGAPTAGIIVCDGGCDFLRANQIRPPSPSEADIFREFLRRTEWVAFVAVVGAEESAPNVFGGSTTHRINARWYVRSDARYEEIEKVVGRAVGLLPTPAFNTATAFLNQNGNGFGQGSMGYSSVSEKSIRISARSLQRLLAGELTVEGFEGAHRWRRELPNDPRPFPNPFSRKLRQGQLIERVDVERGPGDDDLVTFHFGEPDPALAPFRVRRSDDLAKKVRS